MLSAPSEMMRALCTHPVASSGDLGWSGLLAQRWRHDALHDRTSPMAEHVVMAYLGAPRRIERIAGRQRMQATTRSGTITLIPAGQSAYWDIYGSLDVIHAYVPTARIDEMAEELGLPSPDLLGRVCYMDETASALLTMLNRELLGCGRDILFAEQVSELLCMQLLRGHGTSQQDETVQARGGLDARCLTRVVAYIEAHVAQGVSLADLAAVAGLSRSHFCRAFKRSTGLTPSDWLTTTRISQSKALLEQTLLSIADIAARVGYEDPAYFARVFRREIGVSPGDFRRRA